MLSALTATRAMIATALPGAVAWPPAPPSASPRRVRLAPGVFYVPRRHWRPVSALDVAAQMPWDYHAAPGQREYPHPGWHDRAACTGHPHADEVFFGVDEHERHPGRSPGRFELRARAICQRCPVAVRCLAHALAEPELYGVWGGTTGLQRVPLRAQVRAGSAAWEVAAAWLAK